MRNITLFLFLCLSKWIRLLLVSSESLRDNNFKNILSLIVLILWDRNPAALLANLIINLQFSIKGFPTDDEKYYQGRMEWNESDVFDHGVWVTRIPRTTLGSIVRLETPRHALTRATQLLLGTRHFPSHITPNPWHRLRLCQLALRREITIRERSRYAISPPGLWPRRLVVTIKHGNALFGPRSNFPTLVKTHRLRHITQRLEGTIVEFYSW